LLMMSLIFNRSKIEILLFFNLLFFSREEALLLSLFAIFVYISKWGYKIKIFNIANILIFNWLAWLAIYYYYYYWADFSFATGLLSTVMSIKINPVINISIFCLFGSLIFILLYLLFCKLKILKFLPVTIYSSIYIVVFRPDLEKIIQTPKLGLSELANDLIYNPRYSLHFLLFIILLLLIHEIIIKVKIKKIIAICMILGILISLKTNIETYNLIIMQERIRQSKPIYSIKKTMNNMNDKIIVDSTTYQVFYNFENVYVIIESFNNNKYKDKEGRYSVNGIESLIRKGIDYIVVSNKYFSSIRTTLLQTNIYEIDIIFKNNLFVILKLNRK